MRPNSNNELNLINIENSNISRNPNIKLIQSDHPVINITNKDNNVRSDSKSLDIKQNLSNKLNNMTRDNNDNINITNLKTNQIQINNNLTNGENMTLNNNNINNNREFSLISKIPTNVQNLDNNLTQDNSDIIIQKNKLNLFPNNSIFGNIIIKDGKAYYLNPPSQNIIITNNDNININKNLEMNQEMNNYLTNNYNRNPTIPQDTKDEINNDNISKSDFQNNIKTNPFQQLNNNSLIPNNDKNLNKGVSQGIIPQTTPNSNNNIKKQNAKRIVKRGKVPNRNRMLRFKDSNDRPTKQYNVERKRPVYAVPPSKKRAVSQGKPFHLISKYYDENYILEDDEEQASKKEGSPTKNNNENLSEDKKA